MSAVEIVCLSVAALALLLAFAALVAARSARRRAGDLAALEAGRAERPRTQDEPLPGAGPTETQAGTGTERREPTVHLLEPLDDAAPDVVAPTSAQIVDATLGRPLVRAATVTHGLRRALRPESRDRIAALVRREFRRRRKLRMKAGRRAARLAVVVPTDTDTEQERAS